MIVPGSPILKFLSLFCFDVSSHKKTPWFSYFRHAFILYLRFLKEKKERAVKTILLPDYMCHEVVKSLRDEGYDIVFYPLDKDFEIDIEVLQKLLEAAQKIDVVVVAHFYGKIVRNFSDIAGLCQKNNILLIEDCAHVPNSPSALSADMMADARIFSHRKLFALPDGAQIILKNEQEAFHNFVRDKIKLVYGPGYFDITKWIIKALLKKLLFVFNIELKRTYHDLSQDPLKPYNFSRPFVSRLLKSRDITFCVEQRRKNYASYLSKIKKIGDWFQPIKFDISIDVPYQLLLTLRNDVDQMDFINFFLEKCVAAVLGMAIDEGILKGLSEDHPYRHQVALPLHQSLSEKHISYVYELLKQYQKEKGLI